MVRRSQPSSQTITLLTVRFRAYLRIRRLGAARFGPADGARGHPAPRARLGGAVHREGRAGGACRLHHLGAPRPFGL